jgi:DNA gyrase/topoisomerase IV subunit B
MTKPADIKSLTDIEHVLARPEMYCGSVQKEIQKRWIVENGKLVEKEVEIIPAILKLFSEVIDNAVDEAIKTNFEFSNKISVNIFGNEVEVKDNGRGLPIEKDKDSNEYKAVLAFTRLRAGSNFTDENNGTIGRFGVGVSLTNIFSKMFQVDTTIVSGLHLRLCCTDSINDYNVKVNKTAGSNGTTVLYKLNFEYFKIDGYDDVHKGLMQKRIFDLAMNFPKIKFKFNGEIVRTSNFKEYVKLIGDDFITYEDGFKLAILPSEDFSQISFVNGIETLRGGNHVELIFYYATNMIRDLIKKRYKIDVKPADIRNKLLIVLSATGILNAKYDSQTKERLVNVFSELNDVIKGLPEEFLKKIVNNDAIIKPIIDTYILKEKLKEKHDVAWKSKKLLKKKIPKLIDATSDNRDECVLFLTEGDSALGQLIKVRDQNIHAGIPLRGKVMNVQNATDRKIVDNKEYQDILSAIGLHIHEESNGIRYGKVVILTDMDEDGNAITALLLNFFYEFWPELFDKGVIRKYLSPLIIATKGKETKSFYNFKDFENFNSEGWMISYYKGLGSLEEADYSKMINQPIEIIFDRDNFTEFSLDVAFGPDSSKRKVWLGE